MIGMEFDSTAGFGIALKQGAKMALEQNTHHKQLQPRGSTSAVANLVGILQEYGGLTLSRQIFYAMEN